MELNQEDFLDKYNLSINDIEKYDINWNVLNDIYFDFVETKDRLEDSANLVAGMLRKQDKVHTVRTRIKDPEHLIAKLIRKTPDRQEKHGRDFQFTVDNYKMEITDLIGVRVIHIFKEDWINIHEFINTTWNVIESQANIREGDDDKIYTDLGIPTNSRETGYRSAHYLIKLYPTMEEIITEIQVRTIFEEGYGEIDHQLSYPNNNVPEVLKLNLLMLNRLAGSADEMASTVRAIKEEWTEMKVALTEKERELDELKNKIEKLDIEKEQKDSLVSDINKVNRNIYNTSLNKSIENIGIIGSINAENLSINKDGLINPEYRSLQEKINPIEKSIRNSSLTTGDVNSIISPRFDTIQTQINTLELQGKHNHSKMFDIGQLKTNRMKDDHND